MSYLSPAWWSSNSSSRNKCHRKTFLSTLVLCAGPIIAGAIQLGCNRDDVDRCLTGVLFSAQDNRSFFWKDVAAVEQLCARLPEVPTCVRAATEGCPDAAKRFLKALLKGYEVVLQSQLCANTTGAIQRRQRFANSSSCLRAKFDNECMKGYISALDRIVTLPNSADKVRNACCLHRSYRVCLADQVTPLCGVEAASNYIQFNSMLSAAPIREVCGTAYADDSCVDVTFEQQQGKQHKQQQQQQQHQRQPQQQQRQPQQQQRQPQQQQRQPQQQPQQQRQPQQQQQQQQRQPQQTQMQPQQQQEQQQQQQQPQQQRELLQLQQQQQGHPQEEHHHQLQPQRQHLLPNRQQQQRRPQQPQQQKPEKAQLVPETSVLGGTGATNGTILSRLLKILIDTAHVEQPSTGEEFDLDEALEFTTCTGESVDECFHGILVSTSANSTSLWGPSTLAHIDDFCARLSRVPRCLRSRMAMCHTSTNEFFKVVKEEAELTVRSSFCLGGPRRTFFVESGRCVYEKVDNSCGHWLARALQAAAKAPSDGEARKKLMCCLTSRYDLCLNEMIRPKCGAAAADLFSALLRRLSLPNQPECRCVLDVAETPLPEGTVMRLLVNMLEDV